MQQPGLEKVRCNEMPMNSCRVLRVEAEDRHKRPLAYFRLAIDEPDRGYGIA